MTDAALKAELDDRTDEQRARITIEGVVTDEELVAIYDAAHVVAVPSVAEGFGLPVIEALSRGKRVVASKASALTELGDLFGKDAVTVVDPYDADAWATQLRAAAKRAPLAPIGIPASIPTDWADFHARLRAVVSR